MEKKEQNGVQQTSEQLGFLLNQNYQNIIQAQQNIIAINKELERRQSSSGSKKTKD